MNKAYKADEVKGMAEIYLTNTLTGKLEKFRSLNPPKVGLYVCGLTPYDSTHLGHGRCYVVFDVVRRALEACGWRVFHAQNFTDMDDKIIKRAQEQNVSPFYIAQKFMEEYFKAAAALNIKRANRYPRVTEHIPEIAAVIKKLIEKGFAYKAENGDVYYAVKSFDGYGKLSKRKTEELMAGARVEVSSYKKNPLDFALWKSLEGLSPGRSESVVGWDSPWGRGRPGWHIECSVMSTKYLGQPFDIHGGGQDLIFPHHENEIAQSEAAASAPFCKYFLHNGFVTINREKMSKSLGNFFTLEEILVKYPAMAIRYYLISEHYRSPLDFSDKAMDEARSALERIQEAVDLLLFVSGEQNLKLKTYNSKLFDKVLDCLRNDFHTPGALAAVQDWATKIFEAFKAKRLTKTQAQKEAQAAAQTLENLLGLIVNLKPPRVPAEARKLVQGRERFRAKKNFQKADEMRNLIREKFNLALEDTPYGPRLKG